MVNRKTVLDGEDTETLEIKPESDADSMQGEQAIAHDSAEEDEDLMQDEEDTDGSV